MTNLEKFEEQLKPYAYANKCWGIKDNKVVDCDDIECNECKFWHGCTDLRFEWLQEEYKETTVDWSKVAVDTPILVSADGKEWFKRYFAKFLNGSVYVYDGGATSWSQYACSNWKYAKLVEVENEI